LCTPRNRVKLPPPPLKCKFLDYPHKKDRFTAYCATNLELNYKWEMHHDSLFPLPLDLMDPDYYNPLKNPSSDYYEPNKEDERILQLLEQREYQKNAKEDILMGEQESFLLQTQYLTGGQEYELSEHQRKGYDDTRDRRKGTKNNNNNNKMAQRSPKELDDEGYHDGYSLNPHSLQNVNQTFIDIQNVHRHPRRNVEVDKMFDVFPHDFLLEHEWEHVQFDNNPAMHTKKLSFLKEHKFHSERMEFAQKCTQNALLRCCNKRETMKANKPENEEDVEMMNNEEINNNEPDWFSLYGFNGNKKKSEYEDESLCRYEWAAEFKPVHINSDKMHFIVIPKDGQHQNEEVFYANFNKRLNLRHRPTDTSNIDKKGLSENDKKFFKQQPMNIKLSVPRTNDSDHE